MRSTAGAWPGRPRIIERCTRPANSAISLAPLCTNTPDKLVHQVTHTVHSSQYSAHLMHFPLFHQGYALGQMPRQGLRIDVPITRVPPCEMERNDNIYSNSSTSIHCPCITGYSGCWWGRIAGKPCNGQSVT